MSTPLKLYQNLLRKKIIKPDEKQLKLANVMNEKFVKITNKSVFNFTKTRGLYLYGGVGTGKTFLMDLLRNIQTYNPKHQIILIMKYLYY